MKIWCDVCDKEKASVFCCADEAALCHSCDRHVHYANKLASMHRRFSLVAPSFKDFPLCDICKEKRALLFCQQDRAILCRECDGPIHQVNEHTRKHNRFLLSGVKLSPSSSSYPKVPSPSSNCSSAKELRTRNHSLSGENFSPPSTQQSGSPYHYGFDDNPHSGDSASATTSSFKEYLIETSPGWKVEDLLDHQFHHQIPVAYDHDFYDPYCNTPHCVWENKPFS